MTLIIDKAISKDADGNYISYQEIAGDSSETKPTEGVATGSIFLEADTGDVYIFSEGEGDWVMTFTLQDS